jgi:signal transduction histidine kinase
LRQVDRLTALVEDLLDVTRIKSGQFTFRREQVDLSEVIRKVATDYSDILRRAGCELDLTVRGSVIGRWDRSRIEQVAIALLSNAMKYGAKGRIVVDVAAKGALARLSVRDFGIGIAPADQERIFERFERAITASHYGGLGLGLYIARQIVVSHQGSIRVKSAPGFGATFTVELPLDPPEEAEAGGAESMPPSGLE